jgi:uncharacterized membrane protein YedE/YeeE
MHRFALITPALLAWFIVTWEAGLRAGFLLLLGLGFGAVLAASRFGFTTGWRALILHRDPWGMVGQMLLLGLCAALSLPLLHQHAHEISGAVAPITWGLLIGAFVFGMAMQLADGCGSGTLYKAGASSPTSWVVLPAFIAGSFFGASHLEAWNAMGGPLQIIGLQHEPEPVDLMQLTSPAMALTITLLGCAAISMLALAMTRARRHATRPWPAVSPRWMWGAVGLALLYVIHLVVAGQPWGIVYGLGLWGAKLASWTGANLSTDSFWGVAPHAQRLLEPVLWDTTSVTNIGLLYGAMVASRWNNRNFHLKQWPAWRPLIISILAGLLMGYSSRLAFGCNVGAYLGGVASGSLHGWLWLGCAFLGSMIGIRLRLKAGIT